MNPFDIMKNVKNMQSKMKDMQEKVKTITADGTAGGDMVTVSINGEMRVTNVSIQPEAVDPSDIGMLEDLVLAATSDAITKIKEKIRQEMSSVTGGMDIPPNIMDSLT